MADVQSVLTDALDAFTLYRVGTRFDGVPVLSRDGRMPDDDTEVWFADSPDRKSTAMALDQETDILWESEPEEYVPPRDAMEDPAEPAMVAAVTIDGEEPTMAMIALKPADPESLAVEGGDPPEALHLTLKFLREAAPWEPERRQLVQDLAQNWAARHEPMAATVGGAGRLGKDGAAVLFLDVPGLSDAREELASAVDMIGGPEGVDVADTYDGFTPHLTTGYGVEPSEDKMGETITFDRVAVHWGPEVVEFPLGGTPEAQTAALTEAEEDEALQAIEAAEERVANLEGMVASLKAHRVEEEVFTGQQAVVASLDALAADYAARLGDAKAQLAVVAALPDDLPDDLVERVQAVLDRLDALEETVADMMVEDTEDEELAGPPPDTGSSVNETLPREMRR